MNLKSSVGVCTNIHGSEGKMVIVPQDPDMFEKNQVVVLFTADDLKNFTKDMNALINFLEAVKTV